MAATIITEVPEHVFDNFGVASEECLLLLELFPGSGAAPPVAVAVPCATIIVYDS